MGSPAIAKTITDWLEAAKIQCFEAWGLYLAEKRGCAEFYTKNNRKKLSKSVVILKNVYFCSGRWLMVATW